MSSTVKVKNIWVEDLFEWFCSHIEFSCGDGCAAIVCKNYKEVATWFEEWYIKTRGRPIRYPRHEYAFTVNYHSENENFIFTDDRNIYFNYHDYVFFVEEDCISMTKKNIKILAIDWR